MSMLNREFSQSKCISVDLLLVLAVLVGCGKVNVVLLVVERDEEVLLVVDVDDEVVASAGRSHWEGRHDHWWATCAIRNDCAEVDGVERSKEGVKCGGEHRPRRANGDGVLSPADVCEGKLLMASLHAREA
eukprot:6492460-Amphidinium_carterae.1